MNTIKVLVVDDEAPARRRLIRMLERLDGVEVVGEAGDGEHALALMRSQPSDLVLLDIDMPQMDGLELAEEPGLPPIVFTTAHAEHALRAFELAAVDYLLKPVSRERLEQALERVRSRPAATNAAPAATAVSDDPVRITARRGNTVHVVDAAEVTRFHAEDKYTVFTHRDRELLIEDSLATLEQRLGAHGFLRVHRSELINVEAVVALHVEDGSTRAELRDGSHAAVSRRLVAELKRRLGIG
ncbi:MAG: LytTR family DNA-binding domain-containing protein [Deltaproteobacteria bacterium]|nr:LytTR family DNA-binding domain-containing protein [Deltaproteobacteria bacterium]